VRVVSWNVWWRFGDDWRERQHGIATTLAELRPDLVALQESWAGDGTSQAAVLGARLGLHAAFAGPSLPPVPDPPERPDQDGVELGVAVLSRWPILRAEPIPLPAVQRPGPPPVTLLTTVGHPAGPLHFATACLEWEPDFAEDHRAQAQALADLLGDPALDGPLPVLLGADLNAAPAAAELAPLLDTMADTWSASGAMGEGITLSSTAPFAPLAATEQLDRRIDYVLARPGRPGQPVTVRAAAVADTPVDGLPPSDHYAVVVDLEP
jgi:endonuclease/exonuclease/phosphatase family metal-dependent hydrolase